MNPCIKYRTYISSGCFGDVYKVITADDQVFALKTFKNVTNLESIRKEINNLCKLQHPHIVRIYGCCFINECSMLMEYCPSNLKYAIKEGIRPCRAFQMFIEILEGIDFIHKKSMVHNDLKPDNILLDPKGAVKIGDFGLARKCEYSICRGSVQGANLYLSPEALKSNSPIYGPKTDMYAIGIILFEMYTSNCSSHLIKKLKCEPERVACEAFSMICENILPMRFEIVCQLLSSYPEQRPSAGRLLHSFEESDQYSKYRSSSSHRSSGSHKSEHRSGSSGSHHSSSTGHNSSGYSSRSSQHHSSSSRSKIQQEICEMALVQFLDKQCRSGASDSSRHSSSSRCGSGHVSSRSHSSRTPESQSSSSRRSGSQRETCEVLTREMARMNLQHEQQSRGGNLCPPVCRPVYCPSPTLPQPPEQRNCNVNVRVSIAGLFGDC